MACICKTCDHWDGDREDMSLRVCGECKVELPPWMEDARERVIYKMTKAMDTCVFWNLDNRE